MGSIEEQNSPTQDTKEEKDTRRICLHFVLIYDSGQNRIGSTIDMAEETHFLRRLEHVKVSCISLKILSKLAKSEDKYE